MIDLGFPETSTDMFGFGSGKECFLLPNTDTKAAEQCSEE